MTQFAWLILREARVVVQVMYVLRFVVGVRLADPNTYVAWRICTGLAAWTCVCVAIYVLNGVSDISGDRHNGSSRPIATGRLPVRTAWRATVWLTLAGLLAASLVSAALVAALVVMLGVGWAYSFGDHPLKNSVIGLVASGTGLGMLTYLAGWLATGAGVPTAELIVFGTGMSLWMGIVGSATKDLKDVSGDLLTGRRTLPIVLGLRWARLVAAAVAVSLGVLCPAVIWVIAPGLALPAVCVLLGGMAVAAVTCHERNGVSGRAPYQAFMRTQYLANLMSLA